MSDQMIEENMRIDEKSFSRIVKNLKEKDFAILTAFRDEYSNKKNRSRNRELIKKFLRPHGMGATLLKGKWKEKQDSGEKVLVDETAMMFTRPDDMDKKDFKKLVIDAIKKYGQDGAVIGLDGKVSIIEQSGKMETIGGKVSINPDKLGDAFSQVRGHTFMFEGILSPKSSIQATFCQALGIAY